MSIMSLTQFLENTSTHALSLTHILETGRPDDDFSRFNSKVNINTDTAIRPLFVQL